MEKERVEPFRGLLERERARLQVEIARLSVVADTRDNLGYGNHMADDATEAFEQAKDMALLRHLENILSEVNAALGKIDAGTYGACETCGRRIDEERLQVLPHARMCMDCQRKMPSSAAVD